jgi:hypothetical protein
LDVLVTRPPADVPVLVFGALKYAEFSTLKA